MRAYKNTEFRIVTSKKCLNVTKELLSFSNIFDQLIPSHAYQKILLHWVIRCSQSEFIKIGYLTSYVKYVYLIQNRSYLEITH